MLAVGMLLNSTINKVIKVDLVVFNKYFLQRIHTERPSGVPYILHRGLASCERTFQSLTNSMVSGQEFDR